MDSSIYCKQSSDDYYLQLLRFAKISGWSEQDYEGKNQQNFIGILNSLPNENKKSESILPLIYEKSLKTKAYEYLSAETQIFLKESTFQLLAMDLAHRRWLETTLEEFKLKDIPIILLKRSAFANNLYSKAAPRLGVDIDILVKEKDFEAACSILSTSMDPIVLSMKRLATHDTLFERVFNSEDGSKPVVEIHRGLTNPYIFSIEESEIWENSREHPAYNSEFVRVLSPEDTLLHLAVHAFRDLDFCTHNLLDAHEVWCQWKPDHEILLQRAKEWDASKVLYYLLFNTKAIMDTPIPQSLLDSLKPGFLTNLINKKILRIEKNQSESQKLVINRSIQMLSQMTFPDSYLNAIRFQLDYIRIRIKDWKATHKG